MGVSGCGKTTIGDLLARELGAPFLDGDSLHPVENVTKMAAAFRAKNFGPRHSELPIGLGFHGVFREGLVETRPATP